MSDSKRIAVLAENEFEDLEMWYPVLRLQEAGHQVTVVGSGSAPEYKGKYGLKIKVDKEIGQVSPPSARVCQGRRLTSTPGIRHDLENAGATWVDAPVVRDGHHVSSRRPDDLPDFMREYLKLLAEA